MKDAFAGPMTSDSTDRTNRTSEILGEARFQKKPVYGRIARQKDKVKNNSPPSFSVILKTSLLAFWRSPWDPTF